MIKGIQSVCFMWWSANGKSVDKVISTIGFGDWEAVTCAGIDAVGIVSDKDTSDVKIGFIYHTMTRFNDGPGYFILSIDNNKKPVYF